MYTVMMKLPPLDHTQSCTLATPAASQTENIDYFFRQHLMNVAAVARGVLTSNVRLKCK